jgi:DNA topoisomerase I
MKSKDESDRQNQGEPETGFFYEVSRRQHNRHKKLFSSIGTSLITPSGAKVPPAWTNIWITTDPKSSIQAIGRDSKGRRVYLYSAEHMGMATAAKFSRIKAFGKIYPSLIKKVRQDSKYSEAALVLYLISKTGFRIGSNSETRARVKAFGASTLRCSHVSVDGNKLSFEFTGKKGIQVNKVLKHNFLSREIERRCYGSADQQIFRTTDDEIRAYLTSIQEGSGFNVKDFRTYLGTLIAFRKIKNMPVPKNRRDFKKYRKKVGQIVSKELGNSPAIALDSYIAPEVFGNWESNSGLPIKTAGGKHASLTDKFLECIHYDQEVPMEEYRDPDPLEQL